MLLLNNLKMSDQNIDLHTAFTCQRIRAKSVRRSIEIAVLTDILNRHWQDQDIGLRRGAALKNGYLIIYSNFTLLIARDYLTIEVSRLK